MLSAPLDGVDLIAQLMTGIGIAAILGIVYLFARAMWRGD